MIVIHKFKLYYLLRLVIIISHIFISSFSILYFSSIEKSYLNNNFDDKLKHIHYNIKSNTDISDSKLKYLVIIKIN